MIGLTVNIRLLGVVEKLVYPFHQVKIKLVMDIVIGPMARGVFAFFVNNLRQGIGYFFPASVDRSCVGGYHIVI
jgi:hypothetical protein